MKKTVIFIVAQMDFVCDNIQKMRIFANIK